MKQPTRIGADVGSREIVCAMRRDGNSVIQASFTNDGEGHKKLIKWATKHGKAVQVCLEATGNYGLELALALHQAKSIEVMVVNPRAIKDFARASMVRAKTDKVDAQTILEFVERMAFTAWQPPSEAVLQLRAVTRRIVQLKNEIVRERNRLHAAECSGPCGDVVANDIEVNIRHLERRIERMEESGLALIKADGELHEKFACLVSVKGIASASAMRLMAELLVLPDDMKAPQWVAHAGLDPRPYESGVSICRPRSITKVGNAHLRAALYMPALVASQCEPEVKAFYEKLVAAGKRPLQAIVAVMRKLLHAIWGMLKHKQNFDGSKFYKTA